MSNFVFTDNPEDPEKGPDEESAEPMLEKWLLEDYGSMTMRERIQTAESLDEYGIAEKIRAQGKSS